MEIVPSKPVRPRRAGRLGLGVLAVSLVVLGLIGALPVFMGLERVAMADDAMGQALPKGSYVLLRRAPAGELEVGDVVSFRDPRGDGSVIRRVATINGGWLRLEGDVAGTESTTMRAVRVRRVVDHTPWVGYPLLVMGGWPAPYLLVAGLGATLLAGLGIGSGRRRRELLEGPAARAVMIPRQPVDPPVVEVTDIPAVPAAPTAPPAPAVAS